MSGCDRLSRRWLIRDDEFDMEPLLMRFRLTYEGRISSAGSAKHVHDIRRAFHPQLKRLWEVEPVLKAQAVNTFREKKMTGEVLPYPVWYTRYGRDYERNGYLFLPLVAQKHNALVGLHILFLRPDPPGSVIMSGDIDNRLKTLFDALRMPLSRQELGGYDIPGEGEEPFFVLLEDDKIISQVAVETDTLLEPTPGAAGQFVANDARVIITVETRVSHNRPENRHLA